MLKGRGASPKKGDLPEQTAKEVKVAAYDPDTKESRVRRWLDNTWRATEEDEDSFVGPDLNKMTEAERWKLER